MLGAIARAAVRRSGCEARRGGALAAGGGLGPCGASRPPRWRALSGLGGEGNGADDDEDGYGLLQHEPSKFVVPRSEGLGNVRAYYIAQKINVVPMFQKMYGRQKNWLEIDSLIVSFPDRPKAGKRAAPLRHVRPPPPPPPDGIGGPLATANAAAAARDAADAAAADAAAAVAEGGALGSDGQVEPGSKRADFPPYAVFFDYGAVVFFNCDEVLQTESIAQAEAFCQGYLKTGGTGSDDFSVELDQKLETWSAFQANRLVLQKLDINNIRVISSVLGQSVALGHYEQVVDGMLQSFDKANSRSSASASQAFLPAQTKLMFKILRESNTVLSEVIVKLGVLDRTRMRDTAWKYEKYFKVWEGLREEFEIDARWDIMNTKTDYLQHNMRFFVELIHSQKSERLEWMIIALISLELLVSLYGLYIGAGH